MSFRAGLLSVEARAEPLARILTEVGRKSGVEFHVQRALRDEPLTISFTDLPLETALRRLVAPAAFTLVLIYEEPVRAGAAAARLAHVWVVERGTPGDAVSVRRPAARGLPPRGRPEPRKEADASVERRPAATDRLGTQPPSTALPRLVEVLTEEDPRNRAAAVEALGKLKDVAAIEPLGRTLLADTDPDVREAAAEALGELASAQSVGLLRQGLTDPDALVRESVVEALGEIGGPHAEQALREALRDRAKDIRESAAATLARLKQRK